MLNSNFSLFRNKYYLVNSCILYQYWLCVLNPLKDQTKLVAY